MNKFEKLHNSTHRVQFAYNQIHNALSSGSSMTWLPCCNLGKMIHLKMGLHKLVKWCHQLQSIL